MIQQIATMHTLMEARHNLKGVPFLANLVFPQLV